MIIIDRERCIGCELCASDCLANAIRFSDGKAEVFKKCFACGHCVAICPQEAVRFEGEEYDMADVEALGAGFGITPDTMLHAIKSRRSIRHFKKEKPGHEQLQMILEAGRFSPTASNAENVSYIAFLEETEELNRIAMEELRSYRGDPERFAQVFPPPMTEKRINFDYDDFLFKGAPAVILTLSPHTVNATIASANMELQAVSMGLGMLYVGFFTRLAEKNERLRSYLGLRDTDQVVTCLAVGYPDVSYQRTVPRKRAKILWR
jgi:nitroreductase/NAD-dependent dihydropyrimidine dehydrogenase PreA subunit